MERRVPLALGAVAAAEEALAQLQAHAQGAALWEVLSARFILRNGPLLGYRGSRAHENITIPCRCRHPNAPQPWAGPWG